MAQKYQQYKTDSERLAVAHSVPCIDWDVVMDWSLEAQTEQAKSSLKKVAVSLYHREEASCGLL